nr:uncharacterized protein LOC109173786 [Ipomoea batatas]
MSDSDSQNASARDYDEGDEAIGESSSPSTGGSTFNQIDEVEHVSPLAEENEGPTRPTASTEDVISAGPGKSPRVVLSKTFPQLNPRNVEQIAATIRQKGVPRELRYGRQNPAPEISSRSRTLPAPGEASSSAPDPRPSSASPAPVATSSSDPNLPEADQNADALPATRKKMVFLNSEVVQQQKCLLTRAERTRALTDAAAKISSEVYDYRIFRTPESYKKANLEPPDYGREEKYEPVPLAVPTTGGSLAEPIQGMSPDRTFIALRERDALASSLVDQIRDKVPGMETIMWWSCNRLGEQIAEDILRLTHTTTDLFSRARALEGIREKEVVPLQKQVSAAEGRIRELEKELAAAEDRAEKAEKKLGEAEARADKAEKAEKEAIDKMKDASSLARARLGVRPGVGVGHLVGEQSHHDGKVRLLEALGQGCVNLLLDSSAARRKGQLPINPGQFVPDLRVDEGGKKLLGYGLVGADEPSKATSILHLVDGLLLSLLCLVGSGLCLAEFLLGLLGSILDGGELLLQLPNSTLGRGDLLLEGHDLFLSDAL